MSCINFVCPQNLVSFCERSLDPRDMNSMIRRNNGVGLSAPQLQDKLKSGDYQFVLEALWSDRDRSRRLNWLQERKDELHPVLMFELAVAKFVASPTIETIVSISIPIMKAASFRVAQDSQCSDDSSVKYGDASERMTLTYLKRLDSRVQAVLHTSIDDVIQNHQNIDANKTKVLETARLSRTTELPSPDWIGWHGMSVFIHGRPNMRPATEYQQIRNQFADEIINKLQNI